MMKWILLSLLVVIGLLKLIQKKTGQDFFHQEKEERKILLISGLILFWVALLGELSGLDVLDKIDRVESYRIIFQQLQVITPVFLLSIIAGMLLLYWQVSPLVHKIVLSERQALYTNKLLRESIERQRFAEEQLRHMAYHDALTGLDNRTQIEENLRFALEYASRNAKYFALIYLDLDHFKDVNDKLGHDAGDILLRTVATRLQASLRHTDKIGRMGGDEFVIIIEDFIDPEFIFVLMRKIQSCLQSPITIREQELNITASMGIANYPLDGSDIPTLMLNADKALYQAKEKGRNNFQFFGLRPAHESLSEVIETE